MAGTISRGIQAPIIRQGDDIVKIVADSVLEVAKADGFTLHEKDVICVTEAVVARADGNYATTEDIAADVKAKLGGETIGCGISNIEQKPFCNLFERDCKRCKKSGINVELPF